ncbi:hypothetical protein ACQ5SO_08445 [Rhodovulum sp. DZ06]|uniref:hypothetical protein n=1 Tax=Rhodovulum sp. DZ06 TaxID=3425126 RepID=UPI003D33C8B9
MFWELIGAIALGVGAGGFAMALRKLSGGRLPGWLVPAAAGIGMIGYSVYMDYAWGPRARDGLPAGLVVVESAAAPTWFKPWTWVSPPEERFAALDVAAARRNDAAPGMRLATLYFYDRRMPPAAMDLLADCPGSRLGQVPQGAALGDAGLPEGVRWRGAEAGDPVLSALCG